MALRKVSAIDDNDEKTFRSFNYQHIKGNGINSNKKLTDSLVDNFCQCNLCLKVQKVLTVPTIANNDLNPPQLFNSRSK